MRLRGEPTLGGDDAQGGLPPVSCGCLGVQGDLEGPCFHTCLDLGPVTSCLRAQARHDSSLK